VGAVRGQNNFKKHQKERMDETTTDIKNALKRFRTNKVKFRSKTQLANMLSDVVNKNPKHLLKYYSMYLEEYILSQSSEGIDMISDETASREVLIAKLRKERLKNTKLHTQLDNAIYLSTKEHNEGKSVPSEYEIAFSQTAAILRELIERMGGSVKLDKSTGQIIDAVPPSGCSDIVADKGMAKYYDEWLKKHPIHGKGHKEAV